MSFRIRYFSQSVQDDILSLPTTLAARYVVLTRRMEAVGPHLGEPHTKSIGQGLLELRLKGAEGIARVFFCVQIGRQIVMLHSFVKKTDRIPARELDVAIARMREVRHEGS